MGEGGCKEREAGVVKVRKKKDERKKDERNDLWNSLEGIY